jgi:putative transport protein
MYGADQLLEALNHLLRQHPVGLLFVILAAGYLIGNLRIRGFALGPVTGVLFAGLLFGHFGFELRPEFGFVLFIFSVGFQAGPGFFEMVRRDGAKYFLLAMVVAATGFVTAAWLARWMDFPVGTSAGLMAGAMTTTPTLAAAQDALTSGAFDLPAGMTPRRAVQNVTTAYAITYLFGLVGLILIIRLVPGRLGIDLPKEAAKAGGEEVGRDPAEQISVRAYRIERGEIVGEAYRELRERLPGGAWVVKLRRGGEFLDVDEETRFELGDEITVVGRLGRFLEGPELVGPEIADPDLLDMEIDSAKIVVTQRDAVGVTLGEIDVADNFGLFLTEVRRLQTKLPIEPALALQRGDVLSVTGPSGRVESLGERLGHLERAVEETDLLTLATGISLGILIGTFSVTIAGVSVGLGTAGGLLTTGLVIGYLRSIRPTFGRIPAAARWVFMELGLQIFMAGVGVSAGGGIVATLANVGPSLVVCGIAVTVAPVLAGWLVGSYLLRLNPAVLLGAITGAMTSGAALSVVNAAARSTVPALGYTGAYAFANVILTLAGTLIVRL